MRIRELDMVNKCILRHIECFFLSFEVIELKIVKLYSL